MPPPTRAASARHVADTAGDGASSDRSPRCSSRRRRSHLAVVHRLTASLPTPPPMVDRNRVHEVRLADAPPPATVAPTRRASSRSNVPRSGYGRRVWLIAHRGEALHRIRRLVTAGSAPRSWSPESVRRPRRRSRTTTDPSALIVGSTSRRAAPRHSSLQISGVRRMIPSRLIGLGDSTMPLPCAQAGERRRRTPTSRRPTSCTCRRTGRRQHRIAQPVHERGHLVAAHALRPGNTGVAWRRPSCSRA